MKHIKKGQRETTFTPERPIGKHFHLHDEFWYVLKGTARAFYIMKDGEKGEFKIGAGDTWMIDAGIEHGADPVTEEFTVIWMHGSYPEGCDKPGRLEMEEEGYIPALKVVKEPTDRYKTTDPETVRW